MKVKFDNPANCCVGSEFYIDMSFIPRAGEVVEIHESLFPAYYSPWLSCPFDDGMVFITVKEVDYSVFKDGSSYPRVLFNFTGCEEI